MTYKIGEKVTDLLQEHPQPGEVVEVFIAQHCNLPTPVIVVKFETGMADRLYHEIAAVK